MSGILWWLGFGLLDHAVWLLPLGLAAAAVFVPGFLGTLLLVGRTWLGGALLGAVLGGILFWELRAGLDHTAAVHAQLAAAEARAQIADARAAFARKEAEDQRAVAGAAADRSRAAESERDDLQEQVADLADHLAAADKRPAAGRPKGCPRGFALSPQDAAALARIGARPH